MDIGNFVIDGASIEQVKEAFHQRHEELYTYSERHNAVEVVNVEATLFGRIEKPKPQHLQSGMALRKFLSLSEAIKGTRPLIFSVDGKAVKAPVYDGRLLGTGDRFTGPAVIEEVTTTIVIEPGWSVEPHESGSYLIQREA